VKIQTIPKIHTIQNHNKRLNRMTAKRKVKEKLAIKVLSQAVKIQCQSQTELNSYSDNFQVVFINYNYFQL
jgi:hypothetical protein